MDLRKKITEAMGKVSPEKSFDAKHPYHYRNYQDNLFCAMGDQALQAYGGGSGGEMIATEQSPAKMASIASSSAMTYNLLGDGPIEIVQGYSLPHGFYQVQYEKQMYTLNMGSKPANLDAFLSNEYEQTAIFCEMKLLEWLGTSRELKPGYRTDRYYFDKSVAYPVFDSLRKKIEAENFQRYDAWQMFKHLLAIYNYTSFSTKADVEAFRKIPSMAGKYTDITLVNVVNEYPGARLSDDPKVQEYYRRALEKEHAEKDKFLAIVNNGEVAKLFRDHCNAFICIQYLSAIEFAACLAMPKEKEAYLTRYF